MFTKVSSEVFETLVLSVSWVSHVLGAGAVRGHASHCQGASRVHGTVILAWIPINILGRDLVKSANDS